MRFAPELWWSISRCSIRCELRAGTGFWKFNGCERQLPFGCASLNIWLKDRIKRLSRNFVFKLLFRYDLRRPSGSQNYLFRRFLTFAGVRTTFLSHLRESELPFGSVNVSQNYRSCKSELPFALWKTRFAGVRTTYFYCSGSQSYLFA